MSSVYKVTYSDNKHVLLVAKNKDHARKMLKEDNVASYLCGKVSKVEDQTKEYKEKNKDIAYTLDQALLSGVYGTLSESYVVHGESYHGWCISSISDVPRQTLWPKKEQIKELREPLVTVALETKKNHPKFYIYRNLNKGGFSVKHRGKVIAVTDSIMAQNVKFQVSESGNNRARENKKKNVHAFAVADSWQNFHPHYDPLSVSSLEEVTYNPFKHTTFVLKDGEIPVTEHHLAFFVEGRCFIPDVKYCLPEYNFAVQARDKQGWTLVSNQDNKAFPATTESQIQAVHQAANVNKEKFSGVST